MGLVEATSSNDTNGLKFLIFNIFTTSMRFTPNKYYYDIIKNML
jgi:hypothetical protein